MPRVKLPEKPPALRVRKDPKDIMQPIQGIMPDSIWEWYFAMALDEYGLGFDYQVDLDGGRDVRGGQVVDFVVYSPTGPVAVFINGPYWHNTAREDEDLMHQAAAKERWGRILVVEEEIKYLSVAKRIVRKELL